MIRGPRVFSQFIKTFPPPPSIIKYKQIQSEIYSEKIIMINNKKY